jgi:hypothetical protein
MGPEARSSQLSSPFCVFFDGASNVQLAGQLLAAKYPRIHVQTCAAHSVSLFFSDVCKSLLFVWQRVDA